MPIVKVQRPVRVFGVAPARQCLVYPEDRKHTRQQVASESVWTRLQAARKGYFEGRWDEDAGIWIIGSPVRPQAW
jgi:hypothetical protein